MLEKITDFHQKYSKQPEDSPVIIIQNRSEVFRRELATILRGMIGSQKIEVIDTENVREVIARIRERVVVALLENSHIEDSIIPLSPHTARIVVGELPKSRHGDQYNNIDHMSLSLEPVQGEGSMLEDWLRVRVKRALDFSISCGLARRSELLELNRPKAGPEDKEKRKKKKKRA